MILKKAILYLTHSFIMLKIDQTYFEIHTVHTAKCLKYVWRFFNIMNERVKENAYVLVDTNYDFYISFS